MKISKLSGAIGVILGMNVFSAQALTITWGDNPGSTFSYSNDPAEMTAFASGIEMRTIDPNGVIST